MSDPVTIDSDRLPGKSVVTQDGRELGDLRAVVIEPRSWRVTRIRVRLRRDLLDELELRRPFVGTQRITIPIEHVAGLGDELVLKPTLNEVAELVERGEATADGDAMPRGDDGVADEGHDASSKE